MTNDQFPAVNKPKTILVVEDSPTQAVVLKAVLGENGLDVVCSFDGPSGLQKAQEIHPDLIVMDVNLPGMNGFQVAQVLKSKLVYADIPIVMLTSRDTPEALIMGPGAGAVDYIPKDAFAIRVLVETIRQMGLIM